MKHHIVLLLWICIIGFGCSQLLTFPITPLHLTRNQSREYYQYKSPPHHLRHFTAEADVETYPLHSLRTLFTLHLNVNGFDYNLSVDTGSSDLFIKGQELEGQPLKKFSCKRCVKQNKHIQIGYLDGFLDTYVHDSEVKLGNHTFNETILVAYSTDKIVNFRKIGGIVGLSFQEISRNPHPNFISTLIKQKIIKKYRFGLKMNFKEPQSSFLTFGGIDHKYIDPAHSISYYDILEDKFSYEFAVSNVKFGDEIFNIQVGLLDSGNTCVSIDAQYTEHMLKQMNKGNNKCQFEDQVGNTIFKNLICDIEDFNALPVISIEMPDDKVFTWQKEYYIDKCKESKITQSGKQIYRCHTFIESVKHKQQLFLGGAWMLKYYSVFDLDIRKIGMAKNSDNPTIQKILERTRQQKIKQVQKTQNTTA